NRASGSAPFDVVFSGVSSVDAQNHAWDFGDGTLATGATPSSHRFVAPGNHVVALTVTDPFGLIAQGKFTVTVEPRFVMIDTNLVLTQRLAFSEVIVTNAGVLTAIPGMDCGNLLLISSTLHLGTNSTGSNAIITSSRLIATTRFAFSGPTLFATSN